RRCGWGGGLGWLRRGGGCRRLLLREGDRRQRCGEDQCGRGTSRPDHRPTSVTAAAIRRKHELLGEFGNVKARRSRRLPSHDIQTKHVNTFPSPVLQPPSFVL